MMKIFRINEFSYGTKTEIINQKKIQTHYLLVNKNENIDQEQQHKAVLGLIFYYNNSLIQASAVLIMSIEYL